MNGNESLNDAQKIKLLIDDAVESYTGSKEIWHRFLARMFELNVAIDSNTIDDLMSKRLPK